MTEARRLTLGRPGPSAARLGPRAFNAGVVDPLREGFVLHKVEFGGKVEG